MHHTYDYQLKWFLLYEKSGFEKFRIKAHNRLVADLDTMGFQVEEAQSFATDVSAAIKKLKEKDIRIVLGNFNETWARRIFCEAHNVQVFDMRKSVQTRVEQLRVLNNSLILHL
ncbi:Gamma-aminobutyric acid type B receptor subunit 1 [Frankliniella fusca]|uniref:Gamma-aminobutyric acid type B receptor subunit 1 n=1 Tax=Frankliniella fusca TaxID=407009 RepID=A0AAE1HXE6_9NEOP|nr:Gamma-aminobutyric acid type B receptor subunit 1 [Frankliniella fusca]